MTDKLLSSNSLAFVTTSIPSFALPTSLAFLACFLVNPFVDVVGGQFVTAFTMGRTFLTARLSVSLLSLVPTSRSGLAACFAMLSSIRISQDILIDPFVTELTMRLDLRSASFSTGTIPICRVFSHAH